MSPTRIGRAQHFVTDWLQLVRDSAGVDLGHHAGAVVLIRGREQAVKRTQARLANDRMMQQWQGASGARALQYRWPQVRRLLTDILGADADAGA